MRHQETTAEDIRDQIDMVLDAQDHLNQAIELIERYCRISDDKYTDAYMLAHLKIWASSSHGYLSGDRNMDDLVEALTEQLAEAEAAEEEERLAEHDAAIEADADAQYAAAEYESEFQPTTAAVPTGAAA